METVITGRIEIFVAQFFKILVYGEVDTINVGAEVLEKVEPISELLWTCVLHKFVEAISESRIFKLDVIWA